MTTATANDAKSNWTRTAMLGGGALAIAGAGLAAGLLLRSPPPAATAAVAAQAAPIATVAAVPTAPSATAAEAPTPVETTQARAQPAAAESHAVPAAGHKPAPVKSDRVQRRAGPPAEPQVAQQARSATESTHAPARIETQPAAAPVCATCGVVESVHAFEKKGEGSGVGAVAGGVLGGVLGNQVGKGNGRAAMTVLGAIGGGIAGHEVEKRTKSETMYEVRIRMEDGTTRTVTQKTAPAPGSRVVVEGGAVRSAEGRAPEPQMVRTAGQGA